MSEILEHLFGSKARSRIMRFFLLNPEQEFSASEAAEKNLLKTIDARREINTLTKIKFVKEKRRKGKKFYVLNAQFSYYPELNSLFVKANTYPQCAGLRKLRNIGTVRLALTSGIFLNYHKSKIDLILVVDNVSRVKLTHTIKQIEAEIGKEIRFMLLSSEEMAYRMNMMDRFLMEFLRSPYNEVIDRLPKLKNFISDFKK